MLVIVIIFNQQHSYEILLEILLQERNWSPEVLDPCYSALQLISGRAGAEPGYDSKTCALSSVQHFLMIISPEYSTHALRLTFLIPHILLPCIQECLKKDFACLKYWARGSGGFIMMHRLARETRRNLNVQNNEEGSQRKQTKGY